jgi:prepilin-type N-terminal cleavage/methylation domain-containing protein
MNFSFKRFGNIFNTNKGFTLIELMITVAIFVLMTSLLLAKYNNYYSGTIFKNQAYDIAITLRQAQSFGISVKVDSQSFGSAYGVSFPSAGVTNFSLYSYTRNGTLYAKNIPQKDYRLKNGAYIEKLEVRANASDNATYANSVDVIFQRPNPEALICADVNGTKSCTTYKYFSIVLKAANDTIKTVKVNNSGQISIIENN